MAHCIVFQISNLERYLSFFKRHIICKSKRCHNLQYKVSYRDQNYHFYLSFLFSFQKTFRFSYFFPALGMTIFRLLTTMVTKHKNNND